MSLCTACSLSCGKPLNCVSGWGNPDAKLVILLDCPGDTLAEKLLIWIAKRCGLNGNDIWVDYVFKCPIDKSTKKKEAKHNYLTCWLKHKRPEYEKAKSVIVSGERGIDLVADKKMKDWHGRKTEDGIWCLYSFKYMLMNPVEVVDAWRVIFRAAEEAGLKPKMVLDIEPFRFPSKKLR